MLTLFVALLLAILLLTALGGLAAWFLPREWRSYGGVLAPPLGCVLLLLVGYYAVHTVLSLFWVPLVALGLVGVPLALANLESRRRKRRAGQKSPSAPAPEAPQPQPRTWRTWLKQLTRLEHGPAWLIFCAAMLLALLPLLSYGYSAPIGENWDPENYLPLTEYLKQGPLSRIVEQPPNPLRDMNAFPPRIGMTLGFSILQGTVWPVGLHALQTFAPTIALLYGLTALSLYALFRLGFGMSRRAGTLATLFAGLYALALWVAFFNFGMQMAALPLVPLALLLWLGVLRYPSWRTVLLAGLAVAALPVAYYPALTVFVPTAFGLGLYEVVRRWAGPAAPARAPAPAGTDTMQEGSSGGRPGSDHPDAAGAGNGASPTQDGRAGTTEEQAHPGMAAPAGTRPAGRTPARHTLPAVLAGLASAALAVVLAGGPILDYGQGFSFRYGQQMTTLGLFHFPALTQVLGLEPFSRTPEALPGVWSGLALLVLFLVLLAALAVIWPRRTNWTWIAGLVPGLLYLAWLRGSFLALAQALNLPAALVDRFRPYPYAFLKGAVFVIPLFWGIAVENWERATAFVAKRGESRLWRAALAGLLLLPLGLVLAANGHLVARYWGQPAHFDAAAMQVQGLTLGLPRGQEVYLTGRPERSRVLLGLFSYFLLENPVQGRLSTAYGGYDRRIPGAEPDVALLDADDDPYALGLSPRGRAEAGGMVRYWRYSTLSFLDLRSDAYTRREPSEIHTSEPLAERLLSGFGSYSTAGVETLGTELCCPGHITRTVALTLYADGRRLSLSDDLSGTAGLGVVTVALASFEPATVTLRWADGRTDSCAVPAGFSTCSSPNHELPARVTIAPQPGATVWPIWAALQEDTMSGVVAIPDEVVLRPEAEASGTVLGVNATLHNASGRPLRLALEAWENTFDGAHHYAWWGPLPLPESGTVRLRADLSTREAQAWSDEQELPFPPHPGADAWPGATDGSYFVALWVYYGGHIVEVLPVGRFQVAAGQVQGLEAIQLGTRLLWPHSPPRASGARFGPAVELAAYQVGSGPFSPGDGVPLALEWHALGQVPLDYSVTAQILRDGQLWGQWDGPLGQWYPAAGWRLGQFVRDDVPLRVADRAPPGRYRLIIAVYDPVSRTRLPVRSAQGQEVGDFLDLGEIVVR